MNLDTVAAAAKVATSAAFAAKTVTDGVADNTADITLTSVSGATVEAIIIWKDVDGGATQSGTNDRLICYLDSYTGLPLTPNGGNVTVAFPGDANKIFKL